MPRFSVCVRGEWWTVPCRDPSRTVGWLGNEALRRYVKNKSGAGQASGQRTGFTLRTCKRLLDQDAKIGDVLEDNSFVELVLEWDFPPAGGVSFSAAPLPLDKNMHFEPKEYISLDGDSLTPASLVSLGKGLLKIKLTPEAEWRVNQARELIETIIKEGRVIYGVNTGFGKFAQTVISPDNLQTLQENLIQSNAAGLGSPLSPERTRMLLALRINVLARGNSGISMDTLQKMIEAFNEKGTVGASGDLAPLAHLALGLMGRGMMWSPKSGWADAKYVLKAYGLTPISLKPKEGLALINGTQLITSLGAEAVERAQAIVRQADIIASLSVEVLQESSKALKRDVYTAWPYPGQKEVVWRFHALLDPDVCSSKMSGRDRSGDPVKVDYTPFCCAQVHGFANDAIVFVKRIISTEMNSSTDNPLVFVERGQVISGGNFHGEYPAKALDYLSIGVQELASISERRIKRLCKLALSKLPTCLVDSDGLDPSFGVVCVSAGTLVSESKALCHPASVESLSTSAATEDHVSMGGWAARKALRVVEHVEQVLAIELLTACQGLELSRPKKTTGPLEHVYQLVRSVVRPWDQDCVVSQGIDAVHKLLIEEQVWEAVRPFLEQCREGPCPPTSAEGTE